MIFGISLKAQEKDTQSDLLVAARILVAIYWKYTLKELYLTIHKHLHKHTLGYQLSNSTNVTKANLPPDNLK